MNRQQWYYAHLRWAVMVEGKEGLRHWEEAVHIFLSEDHNTAFQRALAIGHQAERGHDEGRRCRNGTTLRCKIVYPVLMLPGPSAQFR
jgi:hypothetical protein